MLLLPHSWTRISNKTCRWLCSRDTCSLERKVSHWLWINFNKRCGSDAEFLNHRAGRWPLSHSLLLELVNFSQIMINFKWQFFSPPCSGPLAQFKCCGSNNSSDWAGNEWIKDPDNERLVPDSCCKTPSDLCGRRDHPSNIYRVEVGSRCLGLNLIMLTISGFFTLLISVYHRGVA